MWVLRAVALLYVTQLVLGNERADCEEDGEGNMVCSCKHNCTLNIAESCSKANNAVKPGVTVTSPEVVLMYLRMRQGPTPLNCDIILKGTKDKILVAHVSAPSDSFLHHQRECDDGHPYVSMTSYGTNKPACNFPAYQISAKDLTIRVHFPHGAPGSDVMFFTLHARHEPAETTWGAWEAWGVCDGTCSKASQTRYRPCPSRLTEFNLQPCGTEERQERTCTLSCPASPGETETSLPPLHKLSGSSVAGAIVACLLVAGVVCLLILCRHKLPRLAGVAYTPLQTVSEGRGRRRSRAKFFTRTDHSQGVTLMAHDGLNDSKTAQDL